MGIPTIVTNLDTLKNRLENTDAGWVVDHSDAKAIYEVLINDISKESEIEEKKQKTIQAQNDVLKIYQNRDMALKYLALYKGNK